MGRKKWNEVKSTVRPEVLRRAERKTRAILASMQLDELRKAVGVTQQELAERLGTYQPSISKLERRSDIFVSTLRDVVEALGGWLDVTACFPGGEARLSQFSSGGDQHHFVFAGGDQRGFHPTDAGPTGSQFSRSPGKPKHMLVNLYWAGRATVAGTVPRADDDSSAIAFRTVPRSPQQSASQTGEMEGADGNVALAT